jgi:hypothetical protein
MEWEHNRKGGLCSWDSLQGMFSGGGGGGGADLPAIGSPPADILGQVVSDPASGVSVDTGPGTGITGVTTTPGGGGGGFNPAMIGKVGSGLMGLKNMFTTSPTEKALEQSQKLQMQQAKLTGAAGKEAMQAYQTGKLTPNQQAMVDQFKKQNLAKWRQYLASAGIPESSAMADIEAKVNQDAAVYAQNLLQQDFKNATESLGLSGNTLASSSWLNLQQEKMMAESQAAAMQAIGELFGAMG